jgi:hypothetical protein
LEGCSPEPAGRPLEAPGDGVSRWMVAAALPVNAVQNPAYRPARPPCACDLHVQLVAGFPVRSRYAVDPSTGEMLDIAVGAYNAVCIEFDERFTEVLTAAMLCWRCLLPGAATAAGPCMVGNAAMVLWGSGAEPAPPKPIEGPKR